MGVAYSVALTLGLFSGANIVADQKSRRVKNLLLGFGVRRDLLGQPSDLLLAFTPGRLLQIL